MADAAEDTLKRLVMQDTAQFLGVQRRLGIWTMMPEQGLWYSSAPLARIVPAMAVLERRAARRRLTWRDAEDCLVRRGGMTTTWVTAAAMDEMFERASVRDFWVHRLQTAKTTRSIPILMEFLGDHGNEKHIMSWNVPRFAYGDSISMASDKTLALLRNVVTAGQPVATVPAAPAPGPQLLLLQCAALLGPARSLPCCRPGCTSLSVGRCTACRFTSYCSRQCQQLDWPRHGVLCFSDLTLANNAVLLVNGCCAPAVP